MKKNDISIDQRSVVSHAAAPPPPPAESFASSTTGVPTVGTPLPYAQESDGD